MTQLREICEKLNYRVYDINDKEMPEAGVIVVQQHCVAVLPRTERNEMIAEVLQRQYQNLADKIIGINNGTVDQYKTLRAREIEHTVYIAYDFEWTYEQDQLDDEDNRIVD